MSADRPSNPGRRSGGRRLPPDLTGAEGREWIRLKETGEQVTLVLSGGERITGKIRYMDLSVVSVAPETGEPVLIRKADVKWVSLDEEPKADV